MKNLRSQRGSGLLGILIALVVIAVGGIAISALVGNLTSSSGESKASKEALDLARGKVEELRNFIEKAKFDDDLAATADTGCPYVADPLNPINGVNAKFDREWCVCNVTKAGENPSLDCPDEDDDEVVANLRKIVMRVSYVDPKDPEKTDGTEKRQKVLLNSFIAFSDPSKSGVIATSGNDDPGGAAPSQAASAKEGPEEDTTTPGNGTLVEEGNPTTTSDNIYTNLNTNNNLVVYQGPVESGDVPNPQIKLTVFGGVLLKFSGKLHYSPDVLDSRPTDQTLHVRATSPSFTDWFPLFDKNPIDGGAVDCVSEMNVDPNDNYLCGRYVTYAGGDCSQTAPGINGCPGTQADIDALPDLNGGWYGKVGVYYIPNKDNVQDITTTCLVDELDNKIPAHLYVSGRWAEDADTGVYELEEYEGINTPYDQFDFIRIKKKQDCTDATVDTETFRIIRCLVDEAPNVVRGLNADHEETHEACKPSP